MKKRLAVIFAAISGLVAVSLGIILVSKGLILAIPLIILLLAAGYAAVYAFSGHQTENVRLQLNSLLSDENRLEKKLKLNGNRELNRLGHEVNNLLEKYSKATSAVSESVEAIFIASQQLNAATSESNKALENIAGTILKVTNETNDNVTVVMETTTGLSEVLELSKSTAAASRMTYENSLKVKENAEDGFGKVKDVVSSMGNIAESTNEVMRLIEELDKSARKIGEIVQLITGISNQTNLLALNAAIEAARAGDAGLGFNVVAEEIRKLADESDKAAKQIVELVGDNLDKAEKAVGAMNEVGKMVLIGADNANSVGEKINGIITNISDIVAKIGMINKVTGKQASTMEEMSAAVESIAVNTNNTAGSTEDMSANIEEQVSTMEEIEASISQIANMAANLKKAI